MNVIQNIVKWNKDRLLDKQSFNLYTENLNCLEEIFETFDGLDSIGARELAKHTLDTVTQVGLKELIPEKNDAELLDSFADRIVFSIGAILKMGYDPEKVLEEVYKSIDSRTGEIVDGKFIKDKSEEAKSKWYFPNFNNAKIKEEDIS